MSGCRGYRAAVFGLLVGAGLTGFWSIGRAPTRLTAVDNTGGRVHEPALEVLLDLSE